MISRAVATAAFGPHERIAALTLPTLQRYAERIGAQLFVFSADWLDLVPGPHWIKTRVPGLFDKEGTAFQEVAWIDCDVAVNPEAPDVFAAAGGRFAAFPESTRLPRLDNFREYLSMVCGIDAQPAKYYNTGVMVVPAAAREALEAPPDRELSISVGLRKSRPDKFFNDQDWINSRLHVHQIETVDLPVEFNFMPFPDLWPDRSKAAFVHYAGRFNAVGSGVLEEIRNDLRAWGW